VSDTGADQRIIQSVKAELRFEPDALARFQKQVDADGARQAIDTAVQAHAGEPGSPGTPAFSGRGENDGFLMRVAATVAAAFRHP
jgi:hypothetical protein